MVRVVVAARTNRVSARLPLIVSDYLIGYLLSGDGRRPPCHQTLLAVNQLVLEFSLIQNLPYQYHARLSNWQTPHRNLQISDSN